MIMSMAVTGTASSPIRAAIAAAAGIARPATSQTDPTSLANGNGDSSPSDGADFTAMSPADMQTKAQALYRAGTISLSELGQLTLMPATAVKGWDGGVGFEPTGAANDAA